MTRLLLALLFLLLGLLAYGRIDRGRHSPFAPAPVAHVPGSPAPVPTGTPEPSRRGSADLSGGTPALDLLARLEGRRRLTRAAASTYFDSLFTETDSVVRRWSDQQGLVFVLAVPPGDSAQYDAALLSLMERAVSVWERAGLGIHFSVSQDTTGAQIIARSARQLGSDRAGQTDLQWTRDGVIHSAVITVARLDQQGALIPPEASLAIAMHELGHAMGLAHSPAREDVMYPATRTGTLSQRDLATFALLYELPLGTIRETIP